jgi:hypothetical protein
MDFALQNRGDGTDYPAAGDQPVSNRRWVMKQQLTASAIDTQIALPLPKREMLGLVTVVITDLLNNLSVSVQVQNNQVAVQVCAAVNAINTIISETLTCAIQQK